MYHFTFIDEASNEKSENDISDQQINTAEMVVKQSNDRHNLIEKTASFLHRYLDQPNCVRIFISKN